MEEQTQTTHTRNFHDKYYKLMLLLPVALLILSFVYLGYFYAQTGDFINKDISLTGGTSVTIYDKISASELEQNLSSQLNDIDTRAIYDIVTGEQKAIIVETKSDGEQTKQVLETYLGYNLTSENSSIEFTGSTLSESFYKQLLIAILLAFVFMSIVVFIIFRTFVPSMAVILSAFADIVMTLALVNFFEMKLSTAGIVAFLMLIGYSVDTDILLTNRLLKRHEGSLNQRILGAFKTGITMTLTSIAAVVVSLFIVRSFSIVLTQIFSILLIGLLFDIINTWVTNVCILKWYVKYKEKKNAI